jgi:Mg2+/Co2+ transporter CorC
MMDVFTCGPTDKVNIIMSNAPEKDWPVNRRNKLQPILDILTADDDLLMEEILENMNSTPIGQVLKTIAVLPEVSRQKVLRVRREITEGKYNLNERLDLALEKVLDDLDF